MLSHVPYRKITTRQRYQLAEGTMIGTQFEPAKESERATHYTPQRPTIGYGRRADEEIAAIA